MATYHAIAAAGKAILQLLEDACPRDHFPHARFELYQASSFQSPTGTLDEGISLYLYRVAMNGTRRNFPPRADPDGRRYRPSLPLDLHYLLTPWAGNSDKQQRLLGWAMRVLEDTPILPAGLLNSHSLGAEIFHSNEAVELVYDPLSLQELSVLWESLKPKVMLSVSYVARMVVIESEVELFEAGLAQTRVFEMTKGSA